MYKFINAMNWSPVYGDEETEVEETVEQTQEQEKEAPPAKTFTQDEVNRFVADERRKAQKANERAVKQLEDVKKTASLTAEEKEQLETRIETLKNEFLTKEELSKKEAKKQKEKLDQEKNLLATERNYWKDLYTTTTLDRELLDAASSDKDVFNPKQIVQLLRPDTRLVEEFDEETGKTTGRLIPKVKFLGKDKDGNSIQLELAPTEAVKQMKEMPEHYGNLFLSGSSGGLGGSNVAQSRKGTPPSDPGQYRQWRKENLGK